MKEHMKFVGLLTVSVFLYTPTGFTQDNEESASKDSNVPASQEVEINEDNYRQFMELRNARQQRNILPEDAFKPNTGLQKLDKLPEESQKHLRNQLREIIVQGDEWQPGDEGKHYPYVPSEAASSSPELQKQEAEAWGELVDSYHRREAEIYENSARTQAAMAPDGAANGGSNTGSGSPGDGTGQAGAGGEESRQSRPEKSGTADSYSPSASNDPNARNTGGVSQNAMEFLKGQGLTKQGPGGAGENTSSPVGDSQQGDAQEQSEQQASAGQSPNVDNTSATASNDTEGNSLDGSSQNALEFLQKSGNEGDSAAESSTAPPALTSLESGSEPEGESTTGVSQNALKFLIGEGQQQGQDQAMPADASTPIGTLSIKDLMNAKGVGGANSAPPPPPPAKPKDAQEPIETPPDRDGGGQ
jgi:hypothetical protein